MTASQTQQPRVAPGLSGAGRWTTAARHETTVSLDGAGTDPDGSAWSVCFARPNTGMRHYDGPCRCFTGGPAPSYAPSAGAPPRA